MISYLFAILILVEIVVTSKYDDFIVLFLAFDVGIVRVGYQIPLNLSKILQKIITNRRSKSEPKYTLHYGWFRRRRPYWRSCTRLQKQNFNTLA